MGGLIDSTPLSESMEISAVTEFLFYKVIGSPVLEDCVNVGCLGIFDCEIQALAIGTSISYAVSKFKTEHFVGASIAKGELRNEFFQVSYKACDMCRFIFL